MAISRVITRPRIVIVACIAAAAAFVLADQHEGGHGHSALTDLAASRPPVSSATPVNGSSPIPPRSVPSPTATSPASTHPSRPTPRQHSSSRGTAGAAPTIQPSRAGSAPPRSVTPTPVAGGGPFGRPLYNDITSRNDWPAYQRATDPTQKNLLYQLAGTPLATWLGPSADAGSVNRVTSAADARGQTPIFVTYAIPHRDCGGLSAGGLQTAAQYRSWVDGVRAGIAGRPAVVIIEPDAMGYGCLPPAEKTERIAELKYAVNAFAGDVNTYSYIHAGAAGINPGDMARALKLIDIQKIRGFALNVSGYDATSSELAYGKALDKALGRTMHFVIDTSRNGVGRNPSNASCNPPGRAVGPRPTTRTGSTLVDAFLWLHLAGGSDGQCSAGDPAPGVFMPSYAIAMVQLALDRGIIARLPTPT